MSHSSADEIVRSAGDLARARYSAGANCAESVLAAVPEALGDEGLRLPAGAGIGWTAGIGEGGCLCGALAAGVVLAGLQIDAQPGGPAARRAQGVEAAGELRSQFKEAFGSTCCRVLRQGKEPGTRECRMHCRAITGETAEMVTAMLLARGAAPVPLRKRLGPRDLAAAGVRSVGVAAVALAGFAAAIVLTGASVSAATAAGFGAAALVASAAWALVRAVRTR